MTDSPSSRPAGGVEDRELVERVALRAKLWEMVGRAVSPDLRPESARDLIQEGWDRALGELEEWARSAGDADQLTQQQARWLLSSISKLKRPPESVVTVLRRLAGEADRG